MFCCSLRGIQSWLCVQSSSNYLHLSQMSPHLLALLRLRQRSLQLLALLLFLLEAQESRSSRLFPLWALENRSSCPQFLHRHLSLLGALESCSSTLCLLPGDRQLSPASVELLQLSTASMSPLGALVSQSENHQFNHQLNRPRLLCRHKLNSQQLPCCCLVQLHLCQRSVHHLVLTRTVRYDEIYWMMK